MSRNRKIERPRNACINEAIRSNSRLFTRSLHRGRLFEEPAMVADGSVAVLGEFEKFEKSAFWESAINGQKSGGQHEI
jgi:hypothetical protein